MSMQQVRDGERRLRIAVLEHELEMLHQRELRGRLVTRWLSIIAVIGWATAVTILLVKF